VRIEVDSGTPILEGTNAQIQSISLTGANEIQLNGAVKGAPPINQVGPQGCPVIPASTSGLSALLNSAPQLLNRIQTLTERLSELLSDKNQNAIADILENMDRTTRALSNRSGDLAGAITNARAALLNASIAAQHVSALADNTNQLVTDQGRPAVENLNKTIQSVQHAADDLDAVISDARPGIQNFSKSTLPQLNQTVQQMRGLAQSLQQVSDRVNQQGIGGALGPKQLPDYKPGKRR
jgi:phospholipid/cholesterol/gamma-HCH transport system substrate-binding protein